VKKPIGEKERSPDIRASLVAEAGFALGPKGRFACEERRPGARTNLAGAKTKEARITSGFL